MTHPALSIGNYLIYQEETDSTNDALRRMMLETTLPEGTVVYTGYQHRGRGQESNGWESEPGQNLLMSVLLKPTYLQATEQVWLNLAVCVALRDAVAACGIEDVRIKWPNDIYVGSKKIAGILIENILQGNRLRFSIAGLGLNVNQTEFDTPNASSLRIITGQDFDLKDMREMVCGHLTRTLHQLRGSRREQLLEAYHAHLLGKGVLSRFESAGNKFIAEVIGIDLRGRIHLLSDGEIKSYANKEVQYLGEV